MAKQKAVAKVAEQTSKIAEITAQVASRGIRYLEELAGSAESVVYALCIALWCYVGPEAKDSAGRTLRKARVNGAEECLKPYGMSSMTYSMISRGELITRLGLNPADVQGRARLMKERSKDFKEVKSRQKFLDTCEAFETEQRIARENAARKAAEAAEAAKLAAKQGLSTPPASALVKDAPDGNKVPSAPEPKDITADEALTFLTLAGKARLIPIYGAFGMRGDDPGFSASAFIDFLIDKAQDACAASLLANVAKVGKASKAKRTA